MKIPAIRGYIGNWIYYISVLSFEDISIYVKPVNQELHQTTALSDMIQRSITDNYKKITSYILSQEERFFNSLVLAVYDGDPQWVEVELDYGDEEFFNIGFLDFNGDEKIFPIDGQHRVEGIKAALKEKPELCEEKVPVIFIGHRNTIEGMRKSRRLFSTLNRYATPVSMRDIIALDEDDIVAIVTRELVEECELFKGDRIVYTANKPIPEKNKAAFTSIVNLYKCNDELYKCFIGKQSIAKYKRARRSEEEINQFSEFCFNYWNGFASHIEVVSEYLKESGNKQAIKWRNRDGGNLLFRPIGLLPFTMAVIEIKARSGMDFLHIFKNMNALGLILRENPWRQVLWNDIEQKMLTADNKLVKSLLIYLFNRDLLNENEIKIMKKSYAAKLS
ncbi:MAG TPA: DndB, partial [Clostridiales bacterium]|nr:DndB [Clostridiales bacterium]